jgi:hypothetical protein
MIVITGSLLVLFSAFCFVTAVWRNLFTGAPPPDPDVEQLPPSPPDRCERLSDAGRVGCADEHLVWSHQRKLML